MSIEISQSTAYAAGSCNACEGEESRYGNVFVIRLGPSDHKGGIEIRLCARHLGELRAVARGERLVIP